MNSALTTPSNRVDEQLTQDLARAFQRGGEDLFLVGGGVRDRLLGDSDLDLDFATSALPPHTAEILSSLELGTVRRVGEAYGTIAVDANGRRIEITTYRSNEVYRPGSRKPNVRFGTSLIEDLRRRDFTVNAMALNPLSGEIIDPFDGKRDLQCRLIRAVGTPSDRFEEDPLRMLRAIRFACTLGFTIESNTWDAIRACAGKVRQLSRDRIRSEYTRILESARPEFGMTLLCDSGLLQASVPELMELTRMPDHGPRHPLSLWDHTMRVLSCVPPDLCVRWAALLHDIAKPRTRTHEPSGRPRFFHHETVGAGMANEVLHSLRYPNQIIRDVSFLVESHMQLHAYSPEWSDGAVRRLVLRLGSLLPSALALVRADAAGHSANGCSLNAPKFDDLERRISTLDEEGEDRARSPLSGDDLMERYGRPPGPWIRRIKEALLDEVVEGRLAPDDREAAWKVADGAMESVQ